MNKDERYLLANFIAEWIEQDNLEDHPKPLLEQVEDALDCYFEEDSCNLPTKEEHDAIMALGDLFTRIDKAKEEAE